jgi:hypothetical protein
MRFVSCQWKVRDYFLPELIVLSLTFNDAISIETIRVTSAIGRVINTEHFVG